MILPGLRRDDFVGPPSRVNLFHIRLLLHTVEILVETVEEILEQLMAVVLVEALEVRNNLGHD